MVECSPATRAARVRFPDDASYFCLSSAMRKKQKRKVGPAGPLPATGPCMMETKNSASSGNRTRAARVAGEHSTTEPTMPGQHKMFSQSVGFEPTLPEGNWFLVSRLNHSATTATLFHPRHFCPFVALMQKVEFVVGTYSGYTSQYILHHFNQFGYLGAVA